MRRKGVTSGLVLLASVVIGGTVAVLMGADGNYDLRNYHFYNGWAMFHRPVGYDIAPAQVQSYNHPLLDGIFYGAWTVLNGTPRVFTFVWAVPQAVAVWIAFLVAREILGSDRLGLALAATLIAGDGAASVGVIGTSMSDGIPNALILWGVWLTLREARQPSSPTPWRMALAGFLAGTAVGLKLTTAPYLVGFGAATLLAPGFGSAPLRLRRVAVLVAGAVVALAAVGGPWWWALWREFGNPLFPLYNAWFHSPWYGDWNFSDPRFFPRTASQWAFYPLWWAFHPTRYVAEEPVRDARLALALLASAGLVAARLLRRRVGDGAVWCAVWMLVSYVLWVRVFSILRYASALEVMSGPVIAAALDAVLARRVAARWRAGTVVLLAAVLLATTVYPTWERRLHPGDTLLSVSIPPLPPDSLVIFLVATPASYIAAWEPPSVCYVGVYNSLIALDSRFGLQDRVVQTIRDAPGPIWGVDKTDAFEGMAERSLDRYGLRRTGDCAPIGSNVDTHLRICRLERTG